MISIVKIFPFILAEIFPPDLSVRLLAIESPSPVEACVRAVLAL